MLILILLVYFILAFINLANTPGEWYGDITIVHDYVALILHRTWPFFFSTSEGPFYPYIIAPFIYILGVNYVNYKIASVVVGALGIIGVYLTSSVFFENKKIGLLSSFIASFSFSYLVWARLGNFNIIVPVLVSFFTYFTLSFLKTHKIIHFFFAVLLASLTLITYPGIFVTPVVFIALVFLDLHKKKELQKKFRIIVLSLISFIPVAGLFIHMIYKDTDNFTHGHIGSKVFINNVSFLDVLSRETYYLLKALTMFHVEGDIVFRINVSKSPHLDFISSILFLLGIIYVIKYHKGKILYILFPFIVFTLPSISPALPLIDIPNSARSLGNLPYVFSFVGGGLYFLWELLKKKVSKIVSSETVVIVLVLMMSLNTYKYFYLYKEGLPNRNTAFGKIIAEYIDTYPSSTHIYLTSCCWGEWGQPEPSGIYYVLKNKKGRENLLVTLPDLTCKDLENASNTLIIFNPIQKNKIGEFKKCFANSEKYEHRVDNQEVFTAVILK